MSNNVRESNYLLYLPSIYQTKGETPTFLGQFLKAFEKILSGINDDEKVSINGQELKGIEEILDNIHHMFDPDLADAKFLPWLAGWVALSFEGGERWNDAKKRELITKIVPLYQKRGTKEGLEEYLKICLGNRVKKIRIIDEQSPFQVGFISSVGIDTIIDGLPLYYFYINVFFSTDNKQERMEIINYIRKIIDHEKPAHTCYQIKY
jgi:phage tail-like protein